MADYRDERWQGLRVRTSPVRVRRLLGKLPWVGKSFQRAPYMTGDVKTFVLRVDVVDKALLGARLEVDRHHVDPPVTGEGHSEVFERLSNHNELRLTTPWISTVGQHRIAGTLRLAINAHQSRMSGTLVGFDVKSSDTVYLLVAGIVASLAIGLAGAGVGAWLGSTLGQSSEPIPVIVIGEPPSSQSGTDSDEE